MLRDLPIRNIFLRRNWFLTYLTIMSIAYSAPRNIINTLFEFAYCLVFAQSLHIFQIFVFVLNFRKLLINILLVEINGIRLTRNFRLSNWCRRNRNRLFCRHMHICVFRFWLFYSTFDTYDIGLFVRKK
jgi:hypothetical protein